MSDANASAAPDRNSHDPARGQPLAGAALLHVFRDDAFSAYFRVDVDGVRVAVLKARRSTTIALRPGPHRLAVNGRISLASDTVAQVDVAADEVVVYRIKVPFFGRPTLERIADVAAARAKLARLKAVPPTVAML